LKQLQLIQILCINALGAAAVAEQAEKPPELTASGGHLSVPKRRPAGRRPAWRGLKRLI
jgi:hypothetical protein